MRTKFYWYKYKSKNSLRPFNLCRTSIMLDVEPPREDWSVENWTIDMTRENSVTRPYSDYLLSALDTDFNENRFGACDHVLSEIERIERGDIDQYMYEGQGFMHIISREGVTFEHMIFGVCPEWPLWTCPLSHYKAVLKGFREFVKMPESINSELIIELPEVNEKVSAD